MPYRLKKARFVRLAVVAAALASPLAASGVAQAAIGSGLQSSNTAGPNLVSATPVAGVPGSVQVCFDSVITVGSTAGAQTAYHLKGYDAANDLASNNAQVDPTNTKCVLARFNVTYSANNGPNGTTQQNIDITKYTIVSVDAGAVLGNTGNPASAGNLADSVALTVPLSQQSKDGTRGTSDPGNLVGIVPPTGTNQTTNSLTYLFDRPVSVKQASAFFYVNSAGQGCSGAFVINGDGTTQVTISFGPTSNVPGVTCTGTTTVASATRGGVLQGGVNSLHDQGVPNYNQAVQLSTCSAPCSASGKPTLQSAQLNPNNLDQIIYTFDQNMNVTLNQNAPYNNGGPYYGANQFQAELSNGGFLNGTGATVSGNTVTVNFGGQLSRQAEYAVSAWANGGAVTPADNPTASGYSLPGSAPIGDNTGGRANGFTTAADVMAAQVSGGTITITTDQRVIAVNPGLIRLLTSNGQQVGTTCSASFNSAQGVVYDPNANAVNPVNYGKITLTCPSSQLVNVTMVQFLAGAMQTPLTQVFTAATQTTPGTQGAQPNDDSFNVNQVDTAVRSASILKGYKAVKAHHHKKGKKHHKKH